MPELPEVESVRRGLVRARLHARVIHVWRSALALRTGTAWRHEHVERLLGAVPGRILRRGKFLLWRFVHDDLGQQGLLMHLGMSGRCGVARVGAPVVAHTHLVLRFEDDRELRFVDPRRFGGLRVDAVQKLQQSPPWSTLGPEPIDRTFSGADLALRAGSSRRALREVLLDQRVVAGVGNIYVTEALFEAGVHPLIHANRLRQSAWERVAASLRLVLERGITNGGTSLRDFRNVTGEVGRNQHDLRCYGRAGAPCRRCGAILRDYVHAGRSGVYCPIEQRRPRTRYVE